MLMLLYMCVYVNFLHACQVLLATNEPIVSPAGWKEPLTHPHAL